MLSLRGVPVSSGSDAEAEGALLAGMPPRPLVEARPEGRRSFNRRGIPSRAGSRTDSSSIPISREPRKLASRGTAMPGWRRTTT